MYILYQKLSHDWGWCGGGSRTAGTAKLFLQITLDWFKELYAIDYWALNGSPHQWEYPSFLLYWKNMGMDQPAHTVHSDQYLCFPPFRKYNRYTWLGLKYQNSCSLCSGICRLNWSLLWSQTSEIGILILRL